jgi:hypothetical protein
VIRHCDGTDDNLTHRVPEEDYDPEIMTLSTNWDQIGQRQVPGSRIVRCACGRSFDDVDRLVTWPHEPL